MKYPEQLLIRNHLDQRTFFLRRADSISDSPDVRSQMAAICNQHLVYEALFKEGMQGRAYTEKNAGGFLAWAKSGWADNTYYVFFIVDENSEILGCMDIKSSNLDEAEIGYWASAERPGNVTGALVKLCEQSCDLGFNRFVAYAKWDNQKSINVLLRAGFEIAQDLEHRSGYASYAKRLT